jgi:hypothetical protein
MFIKEGDLVKTSTSNSSLRFGNNQKHVFIFSDVIAFAKEKKGKGVVKYKVDDKTVVQLEKCGVRVGRKGSVWHGSVLHEFAYRTCDGRYSFLRTCL